MNNLRKYREKAGVTGALFAKKVSLSSPTINNIELGKKSPKLNTAHKIVAELNRLGVDCGFIDVFPPSIEIDKAS